MGIIVRQSFRNAIISYVGVAIGFANTIWLFPRILEPEQYGITRILVAVAMIAAQFSQLGTNNATTRFFPRFRTNDKRHRGFLSLLGLVSLTGFTITTALFLLFRVQITGLYAESNNLFGDHYLLLIPLLGAILFFNALDFFSRSLLDSTAAAFLREVALRLFGSAALAIYFFGYTDFEGFMLLFVGGYVAHTLIMTVILAIKDQLRFNSDFLKLDKAMFREMASYCTYAVMGGLAGLTINNIDVLMLGSLSGLADTAVYTVAFYLANVISIPARSVSRIAYAAVAESLNSGDLANVKTIYKKSSISQFVSSGLLFVLIIANFDTAMLFLPERYQGVSLVVLFVGLGKLFDMVTGVNGGIIVASKYYRFDMYATLSLIGISALTNLLLIPRYGLEGAALATMISLVLYNSGKMLFIGKVFRMTPFTWATPKAAAILLISGGLAYAIPTAPYWLADAAMRTAVVGLTGLLPVWWLNLSPEINGLIKKMVRRGNASP